jgi:hypothetical protein
MCASREHGVGVIVGNREQVIGDLFDCWRSGVSSHLQCYTRYTQIGGKVSNFLVFSDTERLLAILDLVYLVLE